MQNVTRSFGQIIALFAFVFASFITPVAAQKVFDDKAAIGNMKEAKGVFMLDFTSAKKTAAYLKVIQGTHADFKRQGVKPSLVIVIIGPTVKFLSNKPSPELEMEQGKHLASIKDSVTKLKALGVRMEMCDVANRIMGVDPKTLHDGLTTVGDGFISMIGWQTQGYKSVTVF